MDSSPVTQLLSDWRLGDRAALDALTPIVYTELRRLAASYMGRERSDHTLQPTALIHEAYIRLIDQGGPAFESRSHFFGVAAHLMRQVLTDFARRRLAGKRGSGKREELHEASAMTEQQSEELLSVHEALDKLAAEDERKAKVIELRDAGRSLDAPPVGIAPPVIIWRRCNTWIQRLWPASICPRFPANNTPASTANGAKNSSTS